MTRFSTIYSQPPAAISFFTPAAAWAQNAMFVAATNVTSDTSATEQRIRSAFENAEKELDRYGRYFTRWDGYRAPPFAPEVLGNAAAILNYSQNLFLNAG